MNTILVTIFFLLADGTPAKDASVVCGNISVYLAGDDDRKPLEGLELILDSRAAFIIEALPPITIDCVATFDGARFVGPIALKKHGDKVRVILRKDT